MNKHVKQILISLIVGLIMVISWGLTFYFFPNTRISVFDVLCTGACTSWVGIEIFREFSKTDK